MILFFIRGKISLIIFTNVNLACKLFSSLYIESIYPYIE